MFIRINMVLLITDLILRVTIYPVVLKLEQVISGLKWCAVLTKRYWLKYWYLVLDL